MEVEKCDAKWKAENRRANERKRIYCCRSYKYIHPPRSPPRCDLGPKRYTFHLLHETYFPFGSRYPVPPSSPISSHMSILPINAPCTIQASPVYLGELARALNELLLRVAGRGVPGGLGQIGAAPLHLQPLRPLNCYGRRKNSQSSRQPTRERNSSPSALTLSLSCHSQDDQYQISPAASREILHHTVWRTWLSMAYSDKKWLYDQFSLHHL